MHPPGLFQILVMVLILLVLFRRRRITRSVSDGMMAFRGKLDDSDPLATELLPGEPAVDANTAADN